MNTRTRIVAALLAGGLALTACSEDSGGTLNDDEAVAARQLDRYQDAQPIPEFDWSQIRQNLIEITVAQVETTQTTSFFFNMGVADPISTCPSIGFPIPTTYQLTNPQQVVANRNDPDDVLPLIEQNGVYTGDSTGTYVMCTDSAGQAYALYWEGFVSTVAGPAIWQDGEIVLTGDPSFDFSEGR